MKKALIVTLFLLLAAAAGAGIWYRQSMGRGGTSLTDTGELPLSGSYAPSGQEQTVAGMADTRLAAMVSSSGQREGIKKYPVTVSRQETRKVTSSSSRSVSEVTVQAGDKVEEGTVLMRYDDENDEIEIQKKEYEIERVKLEIETQQMNIRKMESELPKLKNLDLEEQQLRIRQAQNSIKQKEYNITLMEKEIGNLREMIKEKEVKSKYVGTVTEVKRGDGSSTGNSSDDDDSGSGSKVYTVIIAESQNLVLKGTAKEEDMTSIYEGENVIAYSRVDPLVCWYGIISDVKKPGENKKDGDSSDSGDDTSGFSDTDTGSGAGYTYYVDLESEEGLLVGQHLYMEPDLGQGGRIEGLWIDAANYVWEEDGQTMLWVENSSSRLEKRPVTVSEPDEYGKVLVKEGLDKLEYIALNRSDYREGMRTRHVDEIGTTSQISGRPGSPGGDDAAGDEFFEEDEEFSFDDDMFDMDDGYFGDDEYSDDYGDDEYSDDYGDDEYSDDYDDDEYSDDYDDEYSDDYDDEYDDGSDDDYDYDDEYDDGDDYDE